MILRDALLTEEIEQREAETNEPLLIEFRLLLPLRFDCESIYIGLCKYENRFLISLDGYEYTMDEVINGFKYDKTQDVLVVYQETDWN